MQDARDSPRRAARSSRHSAATSPIPGKYWTPFSSPPRGSAELGPPRCSSPRATSSASRGSQADPGGVSQIPAGPPDRPKPVVHCRARGRGHAYLTDHRRARGPGLRSPGPSAACWFPHPALRADAPGGRGRRRAVDVADRGRAFRRSRTRTPRGVRRAGRDRAATGRPDARTRVQGRRAGQQGRAAGGSPGGRRGRQLEPRPRRGAGSDRQQRRAAHQLGFGDITSEPTAARSWSTTSERHVRRPGRFRQRADLPAQLRAITIHRDIHTGGSGALTDQPLEVPDLDKVELDPHLEILSATAGARCSRSRCCAATGWSVCS